MICFNEVNVWLVREQNAALFNYHLSTIAADASNTSPGSSRCVLHNKGNLIPAIAAPLRARNNPRQTD